MSRADERAILDIDNAWIAAFNAGELQAITEIYTEDAIVMPPGAPEIVGRQAIRAFLGEFFETYDARQRLNNDEVQVAGDWAFIRGNFELELTDRRTQATSVERGKHLVIWSRQAGTWRAARDIWNAS